MRSIGAAVAGCQPVAKPGNGNLETADFRHFPVAKGW
jgi:hypothetical protein